MKHYSASLEELYQLARLRETRSILLSITALLASVAIIFWVFVLTGLSGFPGHPEIEIDAAAVFSLMVVPPALLLVYESRKVLRILTRIRDRPV